MKLLAFLVLFLGVSGTQSVSDTEIRFQDKLDHFKKTRTPEDHGNRIEAQEYIKSQFKNYQLKLHTHAFNTSVKINNRDGPYEGMNIIGIAEASNYSRTPGLPAVLLVGADYDTARDRNPVLNNGAGVAALLETARIYSHHTHWGEYYMKYTVIFVAFDLNTRENGGKGKPGVDYFLREWLWPYLNSTKANFGGAFIIDSVYNVNYQPESQNLPQNFDKMFPESNKRILDSESTGNFLAVVSSNHSHTQDLKNVFIGSYLKDRMQRRFRVEDLTLPEVPGLDISNIETANIWMNMLNHQSQFYFWNFHPNINATSTDITYSLPAILLTDTEEQRNNINCERDPCPETLFSNERLAFANKTVDALVNTLLKRQAYLLPQSGVKGLMPSIYTTVIVIFFTKLLM